MLDICLARAYYIVWLVNRRIAMRTASLFKNGKNQAVRLPKEFEFKNTSEVEVVRDGESIILTPKRKSWTSFAKVDAADCDYLADRSDVIEDGRVQL